MAQFSYDADSTKVFIDGLEMKLTSRIAGETNNDLNDVGGIGDAESKEFPPGHITHRFTLNGIINRNDEAIAKGIFPETSEVTLQGRSFVIEILTIDGVMLERYEGAVCERFSHTLDAYRLYLRDANFRATKRRGTMSA